MFRLIIKGSIQPFTKQVQAVKKAKLPQKAKKGNEVELRQKLAVLHQKQRVARMYLQFQATPTDPLKIIRQRFILKKKFLSKRWLYMPNKREYLSMLDRYMAQIQQIHQEQLVRQNYSMPRTIGEKIALELEFEKTKMYLNFFKDDRLVIKLSLAILFLLTLVEVAYCKI